MEVLYDMLTSEGSPVEYIPLLFLEGVIALECKFIVFFTLCVDFKTKMMVQIQVSAYPTTRLSH